MKRTATTERVVRMLMDNDAFGLRVAEEAGLRSGTAYRVLANLRDEGWANATERVERGNRRIWYTLTDKGRAMAREWFAADSTRVSRYRARPRFVEAVQWDGTNLDEVRKLAGDMAQLDENGVLWIRTPDANERTTLGDWVTTGIHNAYRLEDDTFHVMYEVP
jgi:DNA-binding PadR family transcriptional regulator